MLVHSGENSYNNNDDGGDGTPLCEHGERCVKLTSTSENNPGREFYKCPLPKNGGEQCGFFEWLDGEVRAPRVWQHSW